MTDIDPNTAQYRSAKPKRGGHRKGAGRRPLPAIERLEMRAFMLSPYLSHQINVAAREAKVNRSALVRMVLQLGFDRLRDEFDRDFRNPHDLAWPLQIDY